MEALPDFRRSISTTFRPSLELIAYYRNKNLSSIFEGITATSEFEVYLHESAETAAAFPFYDGKDGTINRAQVDLTKHSEIVDV
jgi:hypothetical protein